jgi:hypothetical protein
MYQLRLYQNYYTFLPDSNVQQEPYVVVGDYKYYVVALMKSIPFVWNWIFKRQQYPYMHF